MVFCLRQGRVHLSDDRSSLVIGSVTQADEGNYRCRVTVARNGTILLDEIPEEETKTIRLIVHGMWGMWEGLVFGPMEIVIFFLLLQLICDCNRRVGF